MNQNKSKNVRSKEDGWYTEDELEEAIGEAYRLKVAGKDGSEIRVEYDLETEDERRIYLSHYDSSNSWNEGSEILLRIDSSVSWSDLFEGHHFGYNLHFVNDFYWVPAGCRRLTAEEIERYNSEYHFDLDEKSILVEDEYKFFVDLDLDVEDEYQEAVNVLEQIKGRKEAKEQEIGMNSK